ncbi:MAG: C40 family peptidase [Flavobacteriia bacterium]|nr:C40 family peptidase [Flavobacteriia bacterium]
MSTKIAYCFVSISPVRSSNNDQAEIVTQLLFGEIVHVEQMQEPWFKIKTYFDNYEGWMDSKHVHFLSEKEVKRWLEGLSRQYKLVDNIITPWGNQRIVKGSYIPALKQFDFNIGQDKYKFIDVNSEKIPVSIFETALEYLNTPYLWGGKSPFGIDCSGLTQQVFRFYDINLPRDASQQVEHGLEVSFDEIQEGDVAFFHNKTGKVTHVGILNGLGKIIHASGHVRIDDFKEEGIFHSETKSKTHTLNCIKRM